MADENSSSTAIPIKSEEPSGSNPDPDVDDGSDEELPIKGGADGKAKMLGGKGLGDYDKAGKNEKNYD